MQYKIQRIKNKIIRYKNKNTKCKKCKMQQNKLIMESIDITKNIVFKIYSITRA